MTSHIRLAQTIYSLLMLYLYYGEKYILVGGL